MIALKLRSLGFRSVVIAERESRLMSRASYVNQARVHNGYHYPRSLPTARRSRENFARFCDQFSYAVDRGLRKYYAIAAGSRVTPDQFQRFCEVAGCAELARDPRFARNADRVRHRETLVPLLAERMHTRPRAEWLAALDAAGVPCGPINDLADVFADPHVRERGMTVRVPHPLQPALELVASPMKLSAAPVTVRRPPPLLGQHTDEVLAEFGLTPTEVARLRADGVIG